MLASVIAWIVLGVIAGFVVSAATDRRLKGLSKDVTLGTIGALAGGWFFNPIGIGGVTGLTLQSLLNAVIGAVVMLSAWHLLRDPVARGPNASK
jgi:uncharacterized membrane protein YeaQ/YmgE (transglycosylase-associated protein family)